MKNAVGVSKWTSAGRNHAVHILDEIKKESIVLCGKRFFSHDVANFNLSEVTCNKCIVKYHKLIEQSVK